MKNKKNWFIVCLILLFIINTIFVVLNKTHFIDNTVHNFWMLFDSAIMDKIMKTITFFGSTKFIVSLAAVVLVISIIKKKPKVGISTASILIISTILNNVIKIIICRERPDYITIIEPTYSYPSGHTMASMTLYGFLIYLLSISKFKKSHKIIGCIILCFFVFLVTSSRIYLGAHYFTDIFGGILLSLILIVSFAILDDKKKILKD